ncbi:MAG: hypothetical protein ABSH20_10530 [Tepidisphaeraceae bacterium]
MLVNLPDCHRFLRDSFDAMYDREFSIEPLHEHCEVVPCGTGFESTLAVAADDHLGAYSRDLRGPTATEVSQIRATFSSVGEYTAFELRPGNLAGCALCRNQNSHLFTNWFYGVAWDWCFVLTWASQKIAWVGCLTDTD